MSLGVVALVLVPPNALASASPNSPGLTKIGAFRSHISHIIFLMQENHAYDSLFGEYCLVTGAYCPQAANGLPGGICIPVSLSNPSIGCVKPYNFTDKLLSLPYDLQHDWASSHIALNNGSMNGFLAADGYYSLGHYNATEVPVEYDLAEEYGLADNFFSGALSYSLPNHWYNVAPTPPAPSLKAILPISKTSTDSLYLNDSNQTPNIESELLNSSVSWKYYDYNLSYCPYPACGYDYWNPLAARAQSYTAPALPHFVAQSEFFSDAANGTLPDISWIIPTFAESDHPPSNITVGEDWIASVVDALEASPDWNSSVLFISWDEYGGFYDHVTPPTVDANGFGFRVPLLAISPWVRQGVVDSKNMSFSSILHLIEDRFRLPCLGVRDCAAALPLNMFDFSRAKPRAPIYFGTYGNISYPMPLQSSGKLPPYYGSYFPPSLPASPALTPAQLATLDWS